MISGAPLGIVNTVLTEGVMASAHVDRPIASSAYSFVRFTGGAVAPWIAGKLGEHVSAGAPMFVGGAMVVLLVVALGASRAHVTAASRAHAARSAVAGATPAPHAGRA